MSLSDMINLHRLAYDFNHPCRDDIETSGPGPRQGLEANVHLASWPTMPWVVWRAACRKTIRDNRLPSPHVIHDQLVEKMNLAATYVVEQRTVRH